MKDERNDTSLVLWLPLHRSDGGSVPSRDAFGHAGAVVGAAWTPSGFRFDGTDDRIVLPDCPVFDIGQGDFSIQFVAGFGNLTSAFTCVVGKKAGAWGSLDPGYEIVVRDNQCWASIADGAAAVGQAASLFFGFCNGGFQHVCFTFDRDGYCRGYRNGVESAGTDISAVGGSLANAVPLGLMSRGGGGYCAPGTLAEVKLYNRCLTPGEVQRDFLAMKWRYR